MSEVRQSLSLQMRVRRRGGTGGGGEFLYHAGKEVCPVFRQETVRDVDEDVGCRQDGVGMLWPLLRRATGTWRLYCVIVALKVFGRAVRPSAPKHDDICALSVSQASRFMIVRFIERATMVTTAETIFRDSD